MSRFTPRGMGWIPDLPDPRDYTLRHETVRRLLKFLKSTQQQNMPDEIDLRRDDLGEYFTEPEDQGPINCSASFAALGLVEYFERRLRGRTFVGSKLFLYKVTRNLCQKHVEKYDCHSTGDTGADLRTTLKAIATIGVLPEEFWPYNAERFDEEPSPFAYRVAQPVAGLRYFRLDEPNCNGLETWERIISFIAAGFPIAFGFVVPTSMTTDAKIPYRGDLESMRGGQAVVAVGFRKNHFGRGQHALLVRSSWGRQWGDNGTSWLPAIFVLRLSLNNSTTIELNRHPKAQRQSTAFGCSEIVQTVPVQFPTSHFQSHVLPLPSFDGDIS